MDDKIVLKWRKNKNGLWETTYGGYKVELFNENSYATYAPTMDRYGSYTNIYTRRALHYDISLPNLLLRLK